MGHTDVVPVNPERLERDPFGGELVDGEVWGRGAIDMLNLTASMAVAFRHLARDGLPAARATSSTSPSPTRRAGSAHGARVDGRPRAATPSGPTTCSPRTAASLGAGRGAVMSVSTSARRASPGGGCACGHAGPRVDAVPQPTTRWSRRPRSCSGSPSTARRRGSTSSGASASRRSGVDDELAAVLLDPAQVDDGARRDAEPRPRRLTSTPARTPRSRRTSATAPGRRT